MNFIVIVERKLNMELYNWYIDHLDGGDRLYICGDVVTTQLRHDEFRKEKLNRVHWKKIISADDKFIAKNTVEFIDENGFKSANGPQPRCTKFIREPIKKIIEPGVEIQSASSTWYLQNQDSFFEKLEEKKKRKN